jgi:hypothetical protein
MTKVVTAHSTPWRLHRGRRRQPKQPLGVGGDRLFTWFSDGDPPSRYDPGVTMSAVSAAFVDQGVSRVGAVIAGRRAYDLSEAWGGSGPLPGVSLFVLPHQVPDAVPAGDPPSTFVTEASNAPSSRSGPPPRARTWPHGGVDRPAGPPGRSAR